MISVVCNILYTLVIAYFSGRLIKKLFNIQQESFSWIAVGFFCYVGCLQIINYLLITVGISSKLLLIIYNLLTVIIIVLCFVLKADLKPDKNDLFGLLIALIISVIGVIRVTQYGLGEDLFDTVHYLSLVNEKSVLSKLGGSESIYYYSGAGQPLDFVYDYQSFYIYEALLIKLFRNLHLTDILTTPSFIYSATISYFVMLGITCKNIWSRLFKGKGKILYGIFWGVASSYFFFKYYNYALAFFGNSWRILIVANIMLFIYDYFKDHNRKLLIVAGLLMNGLIGFSSSGAFINAFASAALIIYAIFFGKDKQTILDSFIPLIFSVPYLIIVLVDISLILALVALLGIAGFMVATYFFLKNDNNLSKYLKVMKVAIVIIVLVIVVYSFFIQNNSQYPYLYFFNDHSLYDMVHDYFGTYTTAILECNIFLWVAVAIYLTMGSDNSSFKKYLLTIVVVFLNPLTTPFIIKYITNFVFYRDFDLFFNFFTLAIFINALSSIKARQLSIAVCTAGIIVLGYFSYAQFTTIFSNAFVPKEGFNAWDRITNDEVSLYEAFTDELKDNPNRVIVLSQASSTKGFMSNIQLVYSVYDTRKADPYEEQRQEAPSELMNIFFVRDYIGQEIYASEPKYEMANDLILQNDIDYLIIRKDQVKLVDGEYLPIYFDIRAISDVIYENDTYVLMKVKY